MTGTRAALIEHLEHRLLLTQATVYEFIGANVYTPPPGSAYQLTGNRGDHFRAEPGVSVEHPTSGYTFGHPSGGSTSFLVENIPTHTELRIAMGWDVDVQGLIPIGPGGESEPTGYWEAVMEFGPYEHWWKTGGLGEGGDPLTFPWHEDSIDVTITATWHGEMVSVANWWLGEATVTRWAPTVTMIPVDTAVENKDDYLPGQAPGFIVSRAGDQLLSALQVSLWDEDGTADVQSDYGVLPTSVTIPQGSSSAFVPLNVINGEEKEWTETVEYELREMQDGRYLLPDPPTPSTPIFATGHIVDDDGVDIEAEGLAEQAEADPGLYVRVNDDDDNNDGVVDGEDTDVNLNDDDLEELTLRFPDEHKSIGLEQAQVKLELSNARYRVWDSGGDLLLPQPNDELHVVLNHTTEGPEMTVYVEALPPPEGVAELGPPPATLTLAGLDVGARPSDSDDGLTLVAIKKPDLDIEINGRLHDEDGEDEDVFKTEETVGAFVPRKADNNGAPRTRLVVRPNTVEQTLTKNTNKIKIYDAQEAGNEIAFDGVGNKFAANQEVTLWIEGLEPSNITRDITVELALTGDQVQRDIVKATVIWVDLSARYAGNVAADNAGKEAFVNLTHREQLDGITTHWSRPPAEGGSPTHIGIGNVEIVGSVVPTDFNHSVLHITRDVESRFYINQDLKLNDSNLDYSDPFPPGNDPSAWQFRDDNPQSGGSQGRIYDLDGPAVNIFGDDVENGVVNESPIGTVLRLRFHARQAVVLDIPGSPRVSPIYEWKLAQSFIKQADGTWSRHEDVVGDNIIMPGQLDHLTWNLQPAQ